MTAPVLTVYADRRWPAKTGIGRVQDTIERARPCDVRVVDLKAAGSIGSPLSPVFLALSLWARAGWTSRSSEPGVFFSAGFIPPLFSRSAVVVVVHDLIHLKYYGRIKKLYYDWVLRPLYRRCEAIVCVSETTKREFVAWSGVDGSRVHVIHNAVDPMFSPDGDVWDAEHRYVLYVGNHRSYKNLSRLVRAYAGSDLPRRTIQLFITGHPDPDLVRLAEDAGVGASVRFLGTVDEADLPRLYRGAAAVAFVSLYEGFGLPIVEAMASGVPVMTSAISAMPEVAGGAALLVNPASVEDISDGLNRIVDDAPLRSRLVRAGRDRVKDFERGSSSSAYWRLIEAMAKPTTRIPAE